MKGGSKARRVRCCNFDIDFESTDVAADFFGITSAGICRVCNDGALTWFNGLVFMYIDI